MPKIRFSRKAVFGFFSSHLEKVVLGIVMLLFVVFVYSGFSLESLGERQTPKALSQAADRSESYYQDNTWEGINGEKGVKDKKQPPTDHLARAQNIQTATQSSAYAAIKPLMPSNKPSGIKREDPELLAPIEVETSVVVAAISTAMADNDIDLLAELENSEMRIKKVRKRKKKSKKMTDAQLAASFGMEDEVFTDDSMASGGGPDIAGEGEEELAIAADRTYPGFRPPGGTFEASAKNKVIVVVKALVPYRQQWEKYDQTLMDAMHYVRGRDFPQYDHFELQRAEVPADPNAELKWRTVSNTFFEQRRSTNRDAAWAGTGGEVSDPRFVNAALTMPIPPIMMRDPAEFALHSKVPRYIENDPTEEDAAEEEEATMSIEELLESSLDNPGAFEEPAEEEGSGQFGFMGGMESAPAGPASSSNSQGPNSDYLLIRSFDMRDLEIGKKYRYRVRVRLEDVNHPKDPRLTPADRAISDDVKARLAEVAKMEAASGRRIGTVATEWAESDDVTISIPRTTLAGPIVDRGREVTLRGTKVKVPVGGDPKAQVLSIVYDPTLSVDVPGFVDASRGAVLDVTQNADVIHPITLVFKKLDEYPITTNRMLLDFRGGEELPEFKKEQEEDEDEDEVIIKDPLLSASEYIFLDLDGNFFIRNDLDDHESFELYKVPEKDEDPEP